jgi:hypothetical protein
MRGIFFSVLALIVVLLTALGIMIFRPSMWKQAAAQFSALAGKSEPAVSPDKASPFTKEEPREDTSRHFTSRIIVPTDDSTVLPTAQSAIAQPSYRFPRDAEIIVGSGKSELLTTFGPPQATITGAELGQLHERLVYLDHVTGEETIIQFLNGKVRNARTYRR